MVFYLGVFAEIPDSEPVSQERMIPAAESGSYGFNVRVIPTHPNLLQEHELRLITWAK